MKIKATSNNLKKLSKKLQSFAFGQDDNGEIDIIVGKEYVVYGTRQNDLGKFYWILTEEINTKVPWWMPDKLFVLVDEVKPTDWEKVEWEGYGHEIVYANPLYNEASEDIEDGTPAGLQAFAEMRKESDKVSG